jgi:small subunit ribosomal protein S2
MNEKIDKKEITKQYIKASVHYGHSPKEWNPKMAPYILYAKYGYHIFDLVKTSKLLRLAGNLLQKKAAKGGTFLFVGTNKISSSSIEKHAKRSNSFYINHRWLGGLLTNWVTIQTQIKQLKHFELQEKNNELIKLSKKESNQVLKKLEKLRYIFDGIKDMQKLPDVVIFTNQLKDSLAIQECLRLGIPTIAIVDTNGNPDLIPYPIPANDDSTASVNFILNYLANRINIGHEQM